MKNVTVMRPAEQGPAPLLAATVIVLICALAAIAMGPFSRAEAKADEENSGARDIRVAESEVATFALPPIDGEYALVTPLPAAENSAVIAISTVVAKHEQAPGKLVALTFDDGPWPGQTDAILRVLEAESVRATFFMVGNQVRRHPEIARRVVEAGHAIGNHTQSHARLDRVNPETIRREITDAQTAIQEVTGVRPRWFRPPGGRMTPKVAVEAARFEMQVVMWTLDSRDWERPPVSRLIEEVLAGAHPDAIVLLHDGGGDRTATIEALGPIIRELKKRGYVFVTLDELR